MTVANGYLGLDTDRSQLTFGNFIAECARRHRAREPVLFEERRITYEGLEREVRQFARALLAAGT